MKGIRLQDVAKLAGVSAATVTRVVRGNGYVSQEKRMQVEKAMRELGFTPRSLSAEAHKGQPPMALLFTTPDSYNPLFDRIAGHLGCELQRQNWQLLPHYILPGETPEDFVRIIDRARKENLCGVIFNCLGDSFDFMPIRRYLISLDIPVVMIERSPDIYGLNKIMMNSEEMLFIAVRTLAHLGHRKLLFISPDNGRYVENMRINGFRAGVSAMEIAATSSFLAVPDYDYAIGRRAISQYAEHRELPTAIIAADSLAAGVLDWLREQGLHVPRDISLIGLDDTHAPFTAPPLTSIAFPVAEIAQNTVRILCEARSGDALPQNILLSTRLVERSSVAPPRSDN